MLECTAGYQPPGAEMPSGDGLPVAGRAGPWLCPASVQGYLLLRKTRRDMSFQSLREDL